MTMLPRTPEEYQRHIAERLNWFEQLADKATSLDERINVTNLLLMEILKVSGGEVPPSPFPPALSRALIDHLTKDKPEFYKFIDIDLSTARTNAPYLESGDFIWVDNQFARGEVTLRLNEEKFGTYDLRRQKYIKGPFYRFFITNGVGQGAIRLFISRGYQAASEPIEMINRADLAARLGSIVTFDRRGDVVCFDDFEAAIIRGTVVGGAYPYGIFLTSETAKSGSQCIRLRPADAADAVVSIHQFNSALVTSRLGAEASFTMPVGEAYIYLYLARHTTTLSEAGGVEFEWQTGKLYYHNAAGGLTYFATIYTPYAHIKVFHTAKLVINFAEKKYVRFLFGDIEIDMSEYAIESYGFVVAPHVVREFGVTNKLGDEVVVYADDFILTQNEP